MRGVRGARVTGWSLLCLPVVALALAGLPATARAQAEADPDDTPAPVPAASPSATRPLPGAVRTPRPPVTPRFELEIDAPDALRAFLLRHLDIQRFREQRSLDLAELERLLDELPANARELLATRGLFSPRISVDPLQPPDEAARAAAGDGPAPLGRIPVRIEPGAVAVVESVQITFVGAGADDADAALQRDEIRREAARLLGQGFTQDDWDRTKTAALRRLTAWRYPGGRIGTSLADVDAARASVRLYIELDTGVRQRIGAVEIEGLQRYDRTLTERTVRLAGLTAGSDYDLGALQAAQQRLIDSGLFDAAFVYVEPGGDSGVLPVRVQVREALRQQWVLGVGGSTDNGARLSVEHTHNRLPGIGWRALSTLRFERQDSLARTEWSSPPDDEGWRWVSLLQAARQEDGLTTTTSQRVRLGQAQDGRQTDRALYLQYDRARTLNPAVRLLGGAVRNESAITANVAWTGQRFDDPLSPHRGAGLGAELGLGTTLGIERKPFGRAHLRWLAYQPLGEQVESLTPVPGQPASRRGTALGRLALRLEAGAVVAGDNTPVPDTQLFLAGGDNSVRGYGLRTIGIDAGDGSVLAGRYKTVLGVEWQRPWRTDAGLPSSLEQVFFVDGGAVANRVRDLDMRWGIGTGLRYNSPVGPLQVDLAYGLDARRWRLHLNVGFVF